MDDLLQKNGYKDPRTITMAKSRTSKKNIKRKNKSNSNTTLLVILSLISDLISNKIRNYITSNKLPIRAIRGNRT